jgi:hypothetical protein
VHMMVAYTQHFDYFIVSISYLTSALAAFWGVAVLDHDRWRAVPALQASNKKQKFSFVQWQAAIAVGFGSIWTMVSSACSTAASCCLLSKQLLAPV